MRADMSKVVTEAPRVGHGAPSKKTGRRLHRDEYDRDDHGATRTKASRLGQYGFDAKVFSDVLGPLRRYLHKQVGRPWDKVYSELCAHLDRRTLSGQHIWSHVTSEVELHTHLRDSQVYANPRWSRWWPVEGLYVHPVSKLLCIAPTRHFRYHQKVDPNVVKLDGMNELRCVDGIWFSCEYRMRPRYKYVKRNGELVHVQDGEERYVFRKQQLGKKALRKHGVFNVRVT